MAMIRAELEFWVESGFLDFVMGVALMAGGAALVVSLIP